MSRYPQAFPPAGWLVASVQDELRASGIGWIGLRYDALIRAWRLGFGTVASRSYAVRRAGELDAKLRRPPQRDVGGYAL